jgi:hypothetical protein
VAGQPPDGFFDDQLGFRARYQYRRIDAQTDPVELAFPDQVGDRLTRQTALGELEEMDGGGSVRDIGPVCDEPGSTAPGRLLQQDAGLQPGQSAAGQQRIPAGVRSIRQALQRCVRFQASASDRLASRRAWCSDDRASISSSRSPSRMGCSLYSVRLIRWSVTRPWGKL